MVDGRFDLRPRADAETADASPATEPQDGDERKRPVGRPRNPRGPRGARYARHGIFTPTEKILLQAILSRAAATYEQIAADLYGDHGPADPYHTIWVMMHRIRRKIEGRGIVISTYHGMGYAVDEANRAALRVLLEARTFGGFRATDR